MPMSMSSTQRAATCVAPESPRAWRPLAGAGVWLIFLGQPVSEIFRRHADWPSRAAGIAVVVAFAVAYLAALAVSLRHSRRGARGRVALFSALALLVVPFGALAGESALGALTFVGVAAVVLFEGRHALALASGVIVSAALAPLLVPGWRAEGSYAFSVALGCLAVFAFLSLVRRNRDLIAAREEVARLAAAEERLRVARDIHDILGHRLTAITVKSELAGKLITRAPERAVAEVAEIERLSREALADVRATVSGYREVTLAVELATARGVLEAAGISAQLPADVVGVLERVPPQRRELFGWVIREGVTNVVRHSGARSCRVSVTADSVEVSDDGRGPSDPVQTAGRAGSGLAGLRERVARAGGRLTAGAREGGGFLLRVELPESGSA